MIEFYIIWSTHVDIYTGVHAVITFQSITSTAAYIHIYMLHAYICYAHTSNLRKPPTIAHVTGRGLRHLRKALTLGKTLYTHPIDTVMGMLLTAVCKSQRHPNMHAVPLYTTNTSSLE